MLGAGIKKLIEPVPKTVVIITGGFDPLHSGHLSYIKAARELGDMLIVGVNSDEWLVRKKGRSFMPFEERISIIQSLQGVEYAIPFNDKDSSAKDAILWARKVFPQSKIIFANGGDRTLNNIPEMDIIDDNIEFVFGVGGEDKANSSSWILEEWKAPKTERQWGYYRVLHEDGPEVKVKELTVDPGKSLSMQRHNNRLELWFVAQGTATVYTINSSSDEELDGVYEKFRNIHIATNQWHRLVNETDKPLKIIEIQYGEECIEEDIERK
jgi:D-beta-D-heptose 7-phosphate kinase/D-beta-D-heptose 1-phosphate adenosyltransferase